MKKGLVIMLGLMTVAFLAACEKEPVNNNPENVDSNIVHVDEGGEVDNSVVDNPVIDEVVNELTEVNEPDVSANQAWPRTSLSIADLNEIDSLLFPKWYSYESYSWDTMETSDSWEYVYPAGVDHSLLLPVHATMANREVVSSTLEDGMFYTLTNVTLQDWGTLSVLYVNDAVTLEYLSASVSDEIGTTLYVFKY